jgi:hypothetical protein
MDASLSRPAARRLARFSILALTVPILGCDGGQTVTPEALQQAKRVWAKAEIRDYDLDWTVKGSNNAHYFVTVRGGEVRKLELVRPSDEKVLLHSGEPQSFGIDGIFKTIADEILIEKSAQPFGQPKGTKVIMRFQPDAKLGYPHWYRRDVLGTPFSVAIEVKKLIPITAGSP